MTRSKIYILMMAMLLLAINVSVVCAQSFRKSLAANGVSLHYTSTARASGNHLIAGGYITYGGDKHFTLLSRFTSSGVNEWSINISPGANSVGQIAAITTVHAMADGNILAAGYVNTDKNSIIQYPYEDAFVTKVNALGEVLWVKNYDRNKMECTRENLFRPFLVAEGLNGEIIVAADMFNCMDNVSSIVLMKLDPSGNVIWTSSYEYPLYLDYRSGIFIENGRISFWKTTFNTTLGRHDLDLLQFDYNSGVLTGKDTWAETAFLNTFGNVLGGYMLHARRLTNGNTLVYGVNSQAFNNIIPGRIHFSVLEFDPANQFIRGYKIIPVTDDMGTIMLNITADENGMVLFNRLYKTSPLDNSYSLGAAMNGQILHQRRFPDASSTFSDPDPLMINDDGTYHFINIHDNILDFYGLSNADQDSGCLGITSTNLFTAEPLQYSRTTTRLPLNKPDTITASDNGYDVSMIFQEEGKRLDLGPDTVICEGNVITLKAPPGFVSYVWNDGTAGRELSVSQPGLYHCTVRDLCGLYYTDSVQVFDAGTFELVIGDSRTVCMNDTMHLTAEPGFINYRWGPEYNLITNVTARILIAKPTADTIYYVRAEKARGCVFFDTVRVSVKRAPQFTIGPDLTICPEDSLVLRSSMQFSAYQWSTGERTPQITVRNSGRYVLTGLLPAGCLVADTVTISTKGCGAAFFMPNAFTPNGDGLNDMIKPTVKGKLVQYRFLIVNRWGQTVFSTDDPLKGWDGKINGIMQDQQTYGWSCVLQQEGLPAEKKKGTITLVR